AKLILDKVIARNDRVRVVAEPTVGYQRRIAMILIHIAVKLIRTALRYQLKLAAAAGTGRCLAAADSCVELFHRIHRRVADDATLKSASDAGARIVLLRPARCEI